jgi:hypothetical protein
VSLAGAEGESAGKRINRMLGAWLRGGAIEKRDLPDKTRRLRANYVLPDPNPTPDVVDNDTPSEPDDAPDDAA